MRWKRLVLVLAFGLVVCFSGAQVFAGPLDNATAALRRGDVARAFQLLLPVARAGNLTAERMVGTFYQMGYGTPRDYYAAAFWLHRAAKQGDVWSEYLLWVMYDKSQGIPRNYATAARWYRLAAKQGWAMAQNNLGVLYAHGRGVPRDYVEAARWYLLAATQECPPAWKSLGLMYSEGLGVPKDYVRAYKWLRLDGMQSWDVSAMHRLDLLRARMTPEQIAEGERLAGEFRPHVSRPPHTAAPPPAGRQPAGDLGSGFFVTASGLVLTNAHVVDRCRQIDVRTAEQTSAARLLAQDSADDLALLATGLRPQSVATLRLSARQGDAIAVYGFPLPGLLAPVGNVTFGNITALAGLGGSSGEMQISAPVQPGNSGGPVLDASGGVVGVVVAKLDALDVAAATRDIPQNVNFAIKATVAANFLQAQGMTFTRGKAGAPLSSAALSAAARPFTVQVACTR